MKIYRKADVRLFLSYGCCYWCKLAIGLLFFLSQPSGLSCKIYWKRYSMCSYIGENRFNLVFDGLSQPSIPINDQVALNFLSGVKL